MTAYESFLTTKRLVAPPVGIPNPPELAPMLFPFQRDITAWALRRGRAALWLDCGLGKTPCAIEWARTVAAHTGKPVLILTPLAVAQQFVTEGAKFGSLVKLCRDGSHVEQPSAEHSGVNVTNYDRLEKFDTSVFGGVVLDESSILKDYTSATRNALIWAFESTPFKLACTATPAPNDHVELGNHAEFLGVMSRTEMLSMFFCHDGGETQTWRLKGHAQRDFWRWVCSWAVNLRKPSDLGYSDEGYDLPPLIIHEHVVKAGADYAQKMGTLFAMDAHGLTDQRAARRASLEERVAVAAQIANAEPDEYWLAWCDLNKESEALASAITGAVEVTGSMTVDMKERLLNSFMGVCICGARSTTKPAAKSTPVTPSIEPSASGRRSRNRKKEKSTSESTSDPGTELRRADSTSSERTPRAELGTQPTRNSESNSSASPGSTQPSSGTEDCEHSSGSRQPTTNQSSSVNAGDALSVATSSATSETADFTSTTATPPAECADYSVPGATLDSETSATTPLCSGERECTCGRLTALVSKPSIAGYGLNLQFCARVLFVGLSNSFEAWYQAIRRTWRFGQTREVHCHVITSEAEGAVVANLKRKQADNEKLSAGMVEHMAEITRAELGATGRTFTGYEPGVRMSLPAWLESGP